MDQRPKQSETHSSTFPQDSDSDSESKIELGSTHTSPETTTSEESDGTLVDTSSYTTSTPSLSGEGDLDSTEGHSQSSVGALPLTDKIHLLMSLLRDLALEKNNSNKEKKSVLPRDVYSICMTYKKLIKTFLIKLFSNPKMREAVPGAASVSSDPSVFSIGQHMENNVVSPTAADASKIWQDMNALQVRFSKISSADLGVNLVVNHGNLR